MWSRHTNRVPSPCHIRGIIHICLCWLSRRRRSTMMHFVFSLLHLVIASSGGIYQRRQTLVILSDAGEQQSRRTHAAHAQIHHRFAPTRAPQLDEGEEARQLWRSGMGAAFLTVWCPPTGMLSETDQKFDCKYILIHKSSILSESGAEYNFKHSFLFFYSNAFNILWKASICLRTTLLYKWDPLCPEPNCLRSPSSDIRNFAPHILNYSSPSVRNSASLAVAHIPHKLADRLLFGIWCSTPQRSPPTPRLSLSLFFFTLGLLELLRGVAAMGKQSKTRQQTPMMKLI